VVMDLGAQLCRPNRPRCDECPVRSGCAWEGVAGDDPAIGSAGVSGRQPRFEGSDRQARGLLMQALTQRAVREDDASNVARRSPPVTQRLVTALVDEGLVVRDDGWLRLP
jgi:A/G-specific adenine glycosylase